MKRFCFAAVWVVLAAVSVDTFAGGLEVPDLGTVAIGRGTAFSARADNLSAFYYNPAGLSKSKGFNLLLSVNLVNLNLDYQRQGSGQTRDMGAGVGFEVQDPSQDYVDGFEAVKDFSKVSGEKPIGPGPLLVFSWGDAFEVEGLALSVGLVAPSSFGFHKYPDNGPQRYVLREMDMLMASVGVGASYALNRYFQIGGVFLSGYALMEMSRAVRPVPSVVHDHLNEDAGGDAGMTIKAQDFFIPSGIIGVLSHPLDWLEIGITIKLPAAVEAVGKVTKLIAPPTDAPQMQIVSGQDDVTAKMSFPLVVRAGVRYIHPSFDVEANYVFENWSSLKNMDLLSGVVVQVDPADDPKPFPDTAVPMNFRDTHSVRLGSDIEVWPKNLVVRVGGYYQTSAYPKNDDTFSIMFPYGEQIGIGGGLTWHASDYLDVTAGYLHVFQFEVTVDRGIVQQVGLPYIELDQDGNEKQIDLGNIVNNGIYTVDLNFFGITVEGHF